MDTNKKIAALAAEKVLAKLGIKEGNTLKTVLPETVFEADAEREDWLELPQFTLEAGKKYKIVIDGGGYVAVGQAGDGFVFCGNPGIIDGDQQNTGGGWVIVSDPTYCDITFDSIDTARLAHDIAIYEMVKLNEPIKEKYMPEEIPAVKKVIRELEESGRIGKGDHYEVTMPIYSPRPIDFSISGMIGMRHWSPLTPSKEDLLGTVLRIRMPGDGLDWPITEDLVVASTDAGLIIGDEFFVAVAYKTGKHSFDIGGRSQTIDFPETGIYGVGFNAEDESMADEAYMRLEWGNIKTIDPKYLPQGPTKLSEFENDLFGHIESVVIEATTDDFKTVTVEGILAPVVTGMCDIPVADIISGDVALTGIATTAEGSGNFDIVEVDGDETQGVAAGYIKYQGSMLGQIAFGLTIADDGHEELCDGVVTIVLAQRAVLEMFESIKVTATRTKKIPAEYVESSAGKVFTATWDETPHDDIEKAFKAGRTCLVTHRDTGMTYQIVSTDNFEAIGVSINPTITNMKVLRINGNGYWTIESRPILPEVTNMDAGKFLRVDKGGQWVAAELPSAEGVAF